MSDKPETPAARGLKAALARRAAQKANATPAPATPAPIAPAKPKAKTWHPPKTEAEKAAFNTANGRVLAVMAHPAFAGHSKTAAKLLSNPKLSAAEIGNLLDVAAADTPAKQQSALTEMQAALAEAKSLNAGAPIQPRGSTASAKVWADAHAKVLGEQGA
jgi:hypothetical protein